MISLHSHAEYSATSIIRSSIDQTLWLSEHWPRSHSYTYYMYKLTPIIGAFGYPNTFARSQRVGIIGVALYVGPIFGKFHMFAFYFGHTSHSLKLRIKFP